MKNEVSCFLQESEEDVRSYSVWNTHDLRISLSPARTAYSKSWSNTWSNTLKTNMALQLKRIHTCSKFTRFRCAFVSKQAQDLKENARVTWRCELFSFLLVSKNGQFQEAIFISLLINYFESEQRTWFSNHFWKGPNICITRSILLWNGDGFGGNGIKDNKLHTRMCSIYKTRCHRAQNAAFPNHSICSHFSLCLKGD